MKRGHQSPFQTEAVFRIPIPCAVTLFQMAV